ncbi:MAG: hypothetical protein JW702_11810 [Clostridiales bacterium]|nr:hypothetical protein [Clostridiales bacterium]
MKGLVLTAKADGNTYAMAKKLSEELDFELQYFKDFKNCIRDYDWIILSSGIYGGKVHKDFLDWINRIDFHNNSKKILLFFTWIGFGKSNIKAYNEVKELLANKNLIADSEFKTYYGKTLLFRRKHPSFEDEFDLKHWVVKKIE